MRPRDVLELCVLALLWGSAYLFIRAAVFEFGPVPLIALRLGISALVLTPLLLVRDGLGAMRPGLRPLAVQGVLFSALPFVLLAWASLSMSAGLTAILNATAPLFAALVARAWLGQRIGPWRALGLAVGFSGVLVLVWGGVSFRAGGTGWALVAMMVASFLWGVGGHYTRVRLGPMSPVAISVGTLAASALVLAPFAIAAWPERAPSARAWLEVAFLGVASSGLGFLLYYRLVRNIGATRATSVTFLNPPVALISAALYLGEPITLQMLAGAAVILVGTGLSLGLIGPRGRAEAVAAVPVAAAPIDAAPVAAAAAVAAPDAPGPLAPGRRPPP
ncbi:MAG TPA: DMT family transporter [Burkholderiaceae bacterium]|nr:DMT family transporter [Burkholderiaceae bacterium]